MSELIPYLKVDFNKDIHSLALAHEISDKIEMINSWITVMNIMKMNHWDCPLTKDIYIVIKANKIKPGKTLMDAVERIDE